MHASGTKVSRRTEDGVPRVRNNYPLRPCRVAAGVFSSRRIERATYDSVSVRDICANLRTIIPITIR